MNRQRVQRLLARAGVPIKSRGAGRPRRRRDAGQHALTELMARLYQDSGWTAAQIAGLTGVSQSTVRDRLRARGVRIRTRGRLNREDRVDVPADALVRLYITARLSAVETGKLLGVSRQVVLRAAHDEGLPVRMGGQEPRHGPAEIQLIDALYADPLVQRALSRYGVPLRPDAGPIWQRFPVPLQVSPQLAEELYVRCGLGGAPRRAAHRAAVADGPQTAGGSRRCPQACGRPDSVHAPMASRRPVRQGTGRSGLKPIAEDASVQKRCRPPPGRELGHAQAAAARLDGLRRAR